MNDFFFKTLTPERAMSSADSDRHRVSSGRAVGVVGDPQIRARSGFLNCRASVDSIKATLRGARSLRFFIRCGDYSDLGARAVAHTPGRNVRPSSGTSAAHQQHDCALDLFR